MDSSKKSLSSSPKSSISNRNTADLHEKMGFQIERFEETDENFMCPTMPSDGFASKSQDPMRESKKNFMSPTMSSITKKKILAERKGAPLSDSSNTHSAPIPHLDAPSQITPISSRARASGNQISPYDPVTNYLSPRPEFLRYNPSRCRELLLRVEGVTRNADGSRVGETVSSDLKELSGEEISPVSSSSSQTDLQGKEVHESKGGDGSDADFQGKETHESKGGDGSDAEDDGEEEEEENRPWCSSMVWKFLLLLVVSVSLACSMDPATLPSFQEFGGFQVNHLKIRDRLPQRSGNLSIFPGDIATGYEVISTMKREELKGKGSHHTILNAHLGVSTTGDEEANTGLLISGELTMRVDTEAKESHDGIELVTEREEDMLVEILVNGSDLAAEDKNVEALASIAGAEWTNTSLLISDDLAKRVDSEVKESHGGIELVAETDEDLLAVNGNDLAAEEKNEEAVDSHEFLVHEQSDQRNTSKLMDEGSGVEEIVRAETMETDNVALIDGSLRVSQGRFVSDGSLTFQDSQFDLLGSLETETSSREETELSHVPQSQIVSSTGDVGLTEASEFSTVSDDELKRGPGYLLISKDLLQPRGLWICLSTMILGLLSILCKYFSKSQRWSLPASPPSSESEEKTVLEVPAKEEINDNGSKSILFNHSGDEHKDLYASWPPMVESLGQSLVVDTTVSETGGKKLGYGQKFERRDAEESRSSGPLNQSVDELKELYASRPPTVELLGELLVVETTVPDSGSGQKSDTWGAEELRFSQSQTRRPMRMTTPQKPLRKEDTGNIGEAAANVVMTPLRRSSRIRNRVTSP